MARISAWALALIACAFCSADAAVTAQQSGSAVQKIIQMLTDMAGKAKIEKADEEVAFAKFTTWCAAESVNSKNEIHKNGEEIELLTASIAELTDNVKSLGQEISDLQASVSQHTADKKAQDVKRAKDHASFQEEQQDFSESVDALERAITMLQKQDYDRAGSSASALLQIQADQKLPAAAKSIVTALIGMDGPDYAAPEANGYEFQSGGIVDMLKKLNDEFREKLATCQKEEANSKHAYNMIVEDLTDSIENAEKDASEKTAEKEGKAEKKALDQKQLNAVVAMKAENEKMFSETTAECSEKKMSFEEKQTLRAEEIQAIMKAVEIMGSPDVAGASEKHLALAQAGQAKALIQHLRSANVQTGKEESDMSPRRRVKAFLESEGDRLKSKDLSLLAQKLASDPFAKVKKMIDDMITRLMEEAKQDAEHEGFCDTELGKNKITRNKLSEDIDMLTSSVENGKSEIMMLSESTADLSKELAQLDQAVQEATVLRNGEKSKNSATVKDAEAAQTAIAAASAVLREFYEKAATATGFLQTQKRPTMGSEEWNSLANPNFKGEVDKGHKAGDRKSVV